MKIALVSVYVHNPLEAHQFYTKTLGFVSKMYMPEANLAIVASLEEPDSTGILLEPNNNPIAKHYQEALYQANLPVITFSLVDIQDEYERLKALGVVFRKVPTKTDWCIEAVLEDTCGNLIQLVQL